MKQATVVEKLSNEKYTNNALESTHPDSAKGTEVIGNL